MTDDGETPDEVVVVWEVYTDKDYIHIRRVFAGPDADENARLFISRSSGLYKRERMPVSREFQPESE
jgi:hypothetical protein